MTVQEKPYPVVSRVVDTFGEWLKHRRELREMREMDAANFGRIAGDLRVPADLDTLVRRGPHAADELPKLLKSPRHRRGRSGADRASGAARHGAGLRHVPPASANATTISLPAPRPRTTKSIAPTLRTIDGLGPRATSRAVAHGLPKMTRSTWLHISIALPRARGPPVRAAAQCERRPAAVRQRLGRASSRQGLVQGLPCDRGRDRGTQRSPAGFRRDRQPAIDHGAVVEGILQDQPSPDAQSHHQRRIRPTISRITS